MKPDVLVVGELMPYAMQKLAEGYTLHKLYEAGDKEAFLREVGGRIRAFATDGHYGATAAEIDACPNLGIIGCCGAGTDNIDVEYARRKGIPVTNTPGVLNEDTANLAVALLLATTRGLVVHDRYAREGRWKREGDPPLARSIYDRRAGLVGLGRIGRTIAEKLGAFRVEVAYHARHKGSDVPYPYYSDLVALARDSDFLILAVPGGAATKGLVDREVIDALGPEGILINVGRGSVVDEAAMVAALQEGRLGGAGLDVFANEPNIPQALTTMDNVVLQPHLGSATVETRRAMDDLLLANLAAHFNSRPLLTPLS
jgi:lactate dehydrogenase-like 2-hydroxyacid dehydrogenase